VPDPDGAASLAPQAAKGPRVGRMIVTVEDQGRVRRQAAHQRVQECGDRELDGLGIRASEGLFELGPPPTLERSHRSLAAERAVGEVIEEPALGPGGEVGVEGEVLGELEGLEAIDDEGSGMAQPEGARGERGGSVDRGVRRGGRRWCGRCRGPGDLTEGSAFTEEGGDGQEEIAPAEPVGGGEGGGEKRLPQKRQRKYWKRRWSEDRMWWPSRTKCHPGLAM